MEKILIIKQTSLGDVLHSTGIVDIVKRNYPDSSITLMIDRSAYEVYKHNPVIDHFIFYDLNRYLEIWKAHTIDIIKEIIGLVKEIRRQDFDLAIDLQGRLRSSLFLYIAKAQKKAAKGRWIGVTSYKNNKIHAIDEMKGLLLKLGLKLYQYPMKIVFSEEDKQPVIEFLSKVDRGNKKIIVISAFTRWASKNWPLEHYAKLIDSLPYEHIICLTGTLGDKTKIQSLQEMTQHPHIYDLSGKLSIPSFACLLSYTSCVLTGDSFVLHLASCKHTPVVALFGPTDSTRVGPIDTNSIVLRPIDCDMCYNPHCKRNCLSQVSIDKVHKAITSFLN